jgi:hypothetical protein
MQLKSKQVEDNLLDTRTIYWFQVRVLSMMSQRKCNVGGSGQVVIVVLYLTLSFN